MIIVTIVYNIVFLLAFLSGYRSVVTMGGLTEVAMRARRGMA